MSVTGHLIQSLICVRARGAQFTFLDGAVRFITDDITSDILKTFASINEVEKPERLDE